MRHALTTLAVLAALSCAACGSVEYKDTNAEVDARTQCVGESGRLGEPVAPWCKREQSATWSSDSESKPVDFTGGDDD